MANKNTRHINPFITITGSAKTIANWDNAVRAKATAKSKAKAKDGENKGKGE